MEGVFLCKKYIEFVQSHLDQLKKTAGRGVIKRLSQALECHPTFISQVLKEKAHFSQDQALRFCRFAELSAGETEYFMNLVSSGKAGSVETQNFYKSLMKRQFDARADLKTRWKEQYANLEQNESLYFSSWILQMVHALGSVDQLAEV